MTQEQIRDTARRIAAKFFDIGVDPSYLKLLECPEMSDIPAVKLLRCAIEVLESAPDKAVTALVAANQQADEAESELAECRCSQCEAKRQHAEERVRILRFIRTIRDSFPAAEECYTNGSCYRLHLMLREVWPEATPYTNVDHVISRIDGRYYDITGEVSGEGYWAMGEQDVSKQAGCVWPARTQKRINDA